MRANRLCPLIWGLTLVLSSVPALAQWTGGIGVHNYWVGTRAADYENNSPYIGLFGTAGRVFPVGDRNALFFGADFGFGDSSGLRHGSGDLAHLEGQLSEGYLVVPILAGRSFPITDQLSLVPYAGPSVSLGLWSKMSICIPRSADIPAGFMELGRALRFFCRKTRAICMSEPISD